VATGVLFNLNCFIMKRSFFSFIAVIVFMFIMLGESVQYNTNAENDPRYKCLEEMPDGSLDCIGECGTCSPVAIITGEPID
jgi:hypothetical protein